MDFLEPTAKHIARFLEFWVGFLSPPAASLRRHANDGKVEPLLVIHLGLSVLVSWIIGYIAGRVGPHVTTSGSMQLAMDITYNDIPVVAIVVTFATMVLAALAHGCARLWVILDRLANRGKAPEAGVSELGGALAGNLYDTINGALGFVAFFAPLGVIWIAVLMLVAGMPGGRIASTTATVLAAALFLVYLPAAIAATHRNTRYVDAASSLAIVLIALTAIWGVVTWAV